MKSSRKSSPTSERAPRRCPGAARWRNGARARATLIVTDLEGEKVLGPRFIRLLEEIRAHGSMRRASLELGLGYRHAVAWVRRAESTLGRQLVDRHAGGAAGGGAGLTPDGVELVRQYRSISRELGRIAERAEQLILGENP
jgi:molybdate transport system regulatory protein